jgi:Short C-terminal domain
MQELSAEGRRLVADAAMRYGFSEDAVISLLGSVAAGGGMQAQFNHPEFGGMGQWQQGGMTMIGDMFNNGLKSRVAGLCSELSMALGGPALWRPIAMQSQNQFSGQSQSQNSGGLGVSLFVPGGSSGMWPSEFGAPSSSGSQNDLSYAYFPATRRLAIRRGGVLSVYDTGNHSISGVSQQQSGDQSLTFTSAYGLVRLADLTPVDAGGVMPPPAPSQNFASPPAQPVEPADFAPAPEPQPVSVDPWVVPETPAPTPVVAEPRPAAGSSEEIFFKLERLADLRQRGILSDEEFSKKKAELLSLL